MEESINRKCLDCGRDFEITPSEQKFFTSKELELPKRCLPCRRKRKAERSQS